MTFWRVGFVLGVQAKRIAYARTSERVREFLRASPPLSIPAAPRVCRRHLERSPHWHFLRARTPVSFKYRFLICHPERAIGCRGMKLKPALSLAAIWRVRCEYRLKDLADATHSSSGISKIETQAYALVYNATAGGEIKAGFLWMAESMAGCIILEKEKRERKKEAGASIISIRAHNRSLSCDCETQIFQFWSGLRSNCFSVQGFVILRSANLHFPVTPAYYGENVQHQNVCLIVKYFYL